MLQGHMLSELQDKDVDPSVVVMRRGVDVLQVSVFQTCPAELTQHRTTLAIQHRMASEQRFS